ncbi:MAG: hypothetical protein M5R40_12170 [Anaerolineae bacterium]|nr:hypothetical protein [Anaerolineae bacterium]
MHGLEGGRQERPTRSHGGATQPRIVVVVKWAGMVIVALAALAILVAVVGGTSPTCRRSTTWRRCRYPDAHPAYPEPHEATPGTVIMSCFGR